MRTLLIIITACLICASCGKKEKPEYKSQDIYSKTINIV